MAPRPLGNHIGDDAPVVCGSHLRRSTHRVRRVDAVHPQIAKVDGVDQIAQRPAFVHWPIHLHRGPPAYERRDAPPTAHRARGQRSETGDQVRPSDRRPFAHLHSRDRRLQRATVRRAMLPGCQQLVHIFAHRRPRLTCPEHVLVHRLHVPVRAVGLRCPVRRTERSQCGDRALQLRFQQLHRLPVCQRWNCRDINRHGQGSRPCTERTP
ncbi:unannotated protein [freshwater metagenome]|uniref:Unannotated protein n=1 Tax=freshwater metagenome TaxID=449393 RepID=A0A6J7KTB2_9ZZZZ